MVLELWGMRSTPLLSLDSFPRALGSSPPGYNPLRRDLVNCMALEVLLFRGMPTRPEAFCGMPGASGLRPCAWTHLKEALCHTRPVVGCMSNTPLLPSFPVPLRPGEVAADRILSLVQTELNCVITLN